MASSETLKPVPRAATRITIPRVQQSNLFQRVTHSTKVACCTSQNDIFNVVVAAASMRQYMVVLGPHGLKCSMLAVICAPPRHSRGICCSNLLPYLFSNNRH